MKKYEEPTIEITVFCSYSVLCESALPKTLNYDGYITDFTDLSLSDIIAIPEVKNR